MKECYVSAESYEELMLLFTARSLYKPVNVTLTSQQRLELNLRFSKGYKTLYERFGEVHEVSEFKTMLANYIAELKRFGVKDF
jgi:hypothetical protein